MKKIIIISTLIFLTIFKSNAKDDDIIVTIGDKKISKAEFEQIYKKNNSQLNDESDVKSPKEYMDLFINYKLKVLEAEKRGYDTIPSFKSELEGYRNDLAKPYLTDATVTDEMLHEAYYRRLHEIKASHILLKLDKFSSPEDTLKTYNKLIDIRNEYLSGKKTFEELAVEYSEDPSVEYNKGDLGYFKVFNMTPVFENAAYNTPVGEVSMPFRTRFGYHIVKVNDMYTNNEGKMQIAHIMKVFSKPYDPTPEEDKAYKAEMDSIYTLLQNGADWDNMVKANSNDAYTKDKGGVFRYITPTFRIKPLADAAFSLKNDGDIAAPVKTPYGWHIVKRINVRPNPTFDEVKDEYLKKIKKDPIRSQHCKKSFVEKCKKQYSFKSFNENITKFKNYIYNINTEILPNKLPDDILALKMYQVNDKVFTVQDYYSLQLKKVNSPSPKIQVKVFQSHIDEYADEVVISYENSILEEKYPEFKRTIQEYHDGMLLFSIMEKEVWNKAAQDTMGLEAYYNAHKGKYLWEKRFDGMFIRANNEATYNKCKELLDKGIESPDSLYALINTNNEHNIKITQKLCEENTDPRIDYLVFGKPKPQIEITPYDFVHGNVIAAGTPKTLDEAKGLYISDYQDELEQQWINELHKKYNIKINNKVLKTVKSLK